MNDAKLRPPTGVFLTLPAAMGLVGLFFVPWLTLSCNPKAVTLPPEFGQVTGVPADPKDGVVLARASGWDLARGRLTPADRFKAQAELARQGNQHPPIKYWAYGGLVLPALLVGVALLCLSGNLTRSGAGKWMLLLGIGGVVLMCVAASMDYMEEAFDEATDQMAAQGAPMGCPAFQRNLDEATDKAKDVLQTRTTPYLWGCLGLYVLTAGCGLMWVGATDPVRAAPAAVWKTDTRDTRDPCAYLRAIADGPAREPVRPPPLPGAAPPAPPQSAPAATGADAPLRPPGGQQPPGGGFA